MKRWSTPTLALALALMATPAARAASAGSTITRTDRPSPIAWHDCDDPEVDLGGARDRLHPAELSCGEVAVPLDYASPNSTIIRLAMIRVAARGQRHGAVLFNPGGPGGSGFDTIARRGPQFQDELGLAHFDLIGFDPRGVNRSGAIECVDEATAQRDSLVDETPDNTAEREALLRADQDYLFGCRTRYGKQLSLYSTENTARDMDQIRAALGDEQISFLGISYGTFLGGTYATMFPSRVRAMVLDAGFEPNDDTASEDRVTQLLGFERAFDRWIAWCDATSWCGHPGQDSGTRWDRLREQLRDAPLRFDGREVDDWVLHVATISTLYSPLLWPALGEALALAERGDGAGLAALADRYAGRRPDSHDNIAQIGPIIRCASGFGRQELRDVRAAQRLLEQVRRLAPRFGGDITLAGLQRSSRAMCLLLTGARHDEFPLHYQGSAPILVVGGRHDPATPMRWSQELVTELGPSARLATFSGDGHGQVLRNTCVTKLEALVLALGQAAPEGVACAPDPPANAPAWWESIPMEHGRSVALDGLTGMLGFDPGRAAHAVVVAQTAADWYGNMLDSAAGQGIEIGALHRGVVVGTSEVTVASFEGQRATLLYVPADVLAQPKYQPFAQSVQGDAIVIVSIAR